MMSKILQLSNGRNAHFYEKGQGEPLVLIHGVGMQALAWEPQIAYFSKNYHVVSVDMPGHGKSTSLQEGATLTDFVAWAIEFIEILGLGAVNLAGHSMGSLITLGVSVTRPDLVKRMAVLNSVYKRSSQEKEAILSRVTELETGYLDVSTPLKRWFNQEKDRLSISKVNQWLENVNLEGYTTAYSAFAKGDSYYADEWVKVTCPALILTGEDDPNSTAFMTRKMAEQAKKGKAVVIQNERHMVNLTAPQEVNKAMNHWLHEKI